MATERPMQLGMVGLGRMGANLVQRLVRDGHRCVVYDVNAAAVEKLAGERVVGASSLEDLVTKLDGPRAVWLMLPAAITQDTLERTRPVPRPRRRRHRRRQLLLPRRHGARHAARRERRALRRLRHERRRLGTRARLQPHDRRRGRHRHAPRPDLSRRSRPATDGTAQTPGRTRTDGTAPLGYLHCGPNGAGHFVKMVHNGIEYGMMAAIAEGLSILKHANVGTTTVEADAETTPLRDPQYYSFDFDLPEVAEVWRHGSVVGSWLVDLTADALARSPELSDFRDGCRTPARVAGPSKPRSTNRCRRR